MTQPVFGGSSFSSAGVPLAKDAFDLITGEALQTAVAAFPERSFLVDENVQAVAERIYALAATSLAKELLAGQYAGRWIIVSFALGDHASRFGMEIVSAQPPAAVDPKVPQRYGLTCIFDTEPWNEKLAATAVGTRVTVMGQIEQLGEHAIRLRHCELV